MPIHINGLLMKTLLVIAAMIAMGSHLQASSNIIDGVIVEIVDGEVRIRATHTPYSSVPSAKAMMTRRDGHYTLYDIPLASFLTYYIDEIPVSETVMTAYLKPGMRVVIMQNRGRNYFIYVSPRAAGNQLGMLHAVDRDAGTLTLEREQMSFGGGGFGGWPEGPIPLANELKDVPVDESAVELTMDYFPNQLRTITIDDDAIVRSGGLAMPWKQAPLNPDYIEQRTVHHRDSYLVQKARPQMRVEVIPAGFGNWEDLVDNYQTPGTLGFGHGLRHQFLALCTSDQLEQREVEIRSPDEIAAMGSGKIQLTTGFDCIRLAGSWNDQLPDTLFAPIYYKGQSAIVDGFYATHVPHWEAKMARRGRIMVCFNRRGRLTPDRFAFSSEQPLAWGTVTAIDGNTVSLTAPSVAGVPFTGNHQIEIPQTATTHHLGSSIPREQAIQVGQFLMIYPARPQTILHNADLVSHSAPQSRVIRMNRISGYAWTLRKPNDGVQLISEEATQEWVIPENSDAILELAPSARRLAVKIPIYIKTMKLTTYLT